MLGLGKFRYFSGVIIIPLVTFALETRANGDIQAGNLRNVRGVQMRKTSVRSAGTNSGAVSCCWERATLTSSNNRRPRPLRAFLAFLCFSFSSSEQQVSRTHHGTYYGLFPFYRNFSAALPPGREVSALRTLRFPVAVMSGNHTWRAESNFWPRGGEKHPIYLRLTLTRFPFFSSDPSPCSNIQLTDSIGDSRVMWLRTWFGESEESGDCVETSLWTVLFGIYKLGS